MNLIDNTGVISELRAYDVEAGKSETLMRYYAHIEAPNWTPDGRTLIFNSGGRVYAFDLATRESRVIDTGSRVLCNNDHVVSRDGQTLAISSGSADDPRSRVYTLPVGGGEPRLVTKFAPSYLHGISPDGSALAYCAERGGEYDIYVIPVAGDADSEGAQVRERRLTDAPGLNDGPEYSPDGKHIWFNSVRSGLMQAWRMNADGGEQTRMTFDDSVNVWFPHISPDNKSVVTVCYHKGDVDPGDHPANKRVEIRFMNADGGGSRTLFETFGGQGTMNVNSWSPDSRAFAYVAYSESAL